MTAIDVLTQKLVALGATTEMIVLVVEAVTVARDGHRVTRDKRDVSHFVTPETIRVAAKMRKRKQRENEKLQRLAGAAAKANDVAASTVTVTDVTRDMSQNHCDLLSSSTSSVEVLIAEGSKKKRKKEGTEKCARASRMQAGAQFTPEDLQFAIDAGMTADAARAAWVEFVDFWIAIPGQRGTKTNWPATWRNRVRAVGAKGTTNGQRNSAHASARRSGADDFFAGLAEVAADIDRDGAVARPADTDIPRGRVEIDGSRAAGSDGGAGTHQGRYHR